MAGALTISTLNNDTGVLATQNGMTGIAKAWLLYNGATQTISSSFNISSVTYTASGRYIVNLTTAMPSANYAIALSTSSGNGAGASSMYAYVDDFTTPRTASAFRMNSLTSNGSAFFDTSYLGIAVFSS